LTKLLKDYNRQNCFSQAIISKTHIKMYKFSGAYRFGQKIQLLLKKLKTIQKPSDFQSTVMNVKKL